MAELPPQSAATLVVNAQNEVLLVHKAYGGRVYGLPGGVVDPGELPIQAAVREAREEVGVEVCLEYQLGFYHLRGGGRPDQYASVYVASIVSGEPHVVDPREISEIQPIAELLKVIAAVPEPACDIGWADSAAGLGNGVSKCLLSPGSKGLKPSLDL